MSTASTSGQGRKKKSPGLMDQISKLLSGGDKKKRSKGSFRGLAASPQTGSARRKPAENAVVQFFRSIVSSPNPSPKSRWRDALGLASPRAESTKSPLRRRRDQSTLSRIFNLGDAKSRPPPKRWSTIF